MLGIQITYSDNTIETIQMKTRFEEITWDEFVMLYDNANIEDTDRRVLSNISLLSNTDEKVVSNLLPSDIDTIKPFLEFVDHTEIISYRALPEVVTNCKVAFQPWKLLEASKVIIQTHTDGVTLNKAMAGIVKLYTGLEINSMSFVDAYPIVKYFRDELEAFFEQYTRLNDYKPTSEEILAGVNKLNQYGFFTTLHALSKGNPIYYEEMLNVPANQIYQTLVVDFEQAEINRKVQEQSNKVKK